MTEDDQFAAFEVTGESAVRAALATGGWNPDLMAMGHRWLALKDQERERLIEASRSEQRDIALEALLIAKRANKIATIPILITIAAVIIAILSWIFLIH